MRREPLVIIVDHCDLDITISFPNSISQLCLPVTDATKLCDAIMVKVAEAIDHAVSSSYDWLRVPLDIPTCIALKKLCDAIDAVIIGDRVDCDGLADLGNKLRDRVISDSVLNAIRCGDANKLINPDDNAVANFLRWLRSLPLIPPHS